MASVRIVLFNRFFAPDASATSQMLTDLALHLARTGREVHVVASRVPGGEAGREDIDGVAVHRVADARTGRHGLVRRTLAYLDYYRGARRLARQLVDPGDVVVLKTDPPMLSAALAFLAKERGARVVVWLQDLFPEVAQEYGVPGLRGALGKALRGARDRSLARSDVVVAVADTMAQRVEALRCLPRERLRVIHNWADGRAIVPIDSAASPLRRKWGLEDRFVVAYSGNLGRVHEFDTMLDAASLLRDAGDVLFLMIGRGPRLAQVQARVRRDSLANVRFESLQERDTLAQSLGAADVHLSILPSRFEGLVQPSKLYGILAAGRPTIFVGSVTGETGRILREAGSGVAIPTGDARALADAIVRMRDDSAGRTAMGVNARKAFEAAYDMPIALAKWREVLGV